MIIARGYEKRNFERKNVSGKPNARNAERPAKSSVEIGRMLSDGIREIMALPSRSSE